MKYQTREFFSDLQRKICRAIEDVDGEAWILVDKWERKVAGEWQTYVMREGAVFENARVSFCAVDCLLPVVTAMKIELGEGRAFFETGVSLALHPRNPYAPTVHANLRYLERGQTGWFSGGAYLSPHYPIRIDAGHFHNTLKEACDKHSHRHYPFFKKWCDEYSLIKQGSDTPGGGGIFFDYLQGDMESLFPFVKDLGEAFLPAYLPIVQRRSCHNYGEREREFQLASREQRFDFNLAYGHWL